MMKMGSEWFTVVGFATARSLVQCLQPPFRLAVQVGADGEGGWRWLAEKHGGLVKPDIVFFGEQAALQHCFDTVFRRSRISLLPMPRPQPLSLLLLPVGSLLQLPERFFRLVEEDFPACDLLIVMGTSLRVQPFASLTGRVASNVPRLLINREVVGGPDPILEVSHIRKVSHIRRICGGR